MFKVIHLIPYDGTGGVESAARSMINVVDDDIDFSIEYIFPTVSGKKQRYITYNPFYIFSATGHLVSQKPDLLIVSLWRSCLIALFVKFFVKRTRILLLLHSPQPAHFFDSLLTYLTVKKAFQIWADSQATLDQRLPKNIFANGRVISFLINRLKPFERHVLSPIFIYWGRIHLQKGLEKSIRIFAAIQNHYPLARYLIIGPDGGDLARLQRLVYSMNLDNAVSFLGEMDFDQIQQNAQQASFYLQASELEGMALSVVEAMQLGLVPVVTPVGEIANYCRHYQNALLVNSVDEVAIDISTVLENSNLYEELSQNAIRTWAGQPLYSESVLAACRDALAG